MTRAALGLRWQELEIRADETHEHGPCECCGGITRIAGGWAARAADTVACYFVGWAPGRRTHGAWFDLLLGPWGEGTTAQQRCAVSLFFFVGDTSGGFRVDDAATRPLGQGSLAAHALARADVLGQPIAADAFAIADAILLRDPRLEEIRGWWNELQARR